MRYGFYDTRHPRFLRDEYVSMAIGFVVIVLAIVGVVSLFPKPTPATIISPIPEPEAGQSGQLQTPTATPTMTIAPTPTVIQRPTKGKASYYSIDGCLGCNPGRIMANGQKLDDTRLTLAYNHAPLNSHVKIINTKTGVSVVATVTDRGGFERHGKIADLSVATRDALGCGDTCPIELVW